MAVAEAVTAAAVAADYQSQVTRVGETLAVTLTRLWRRSVAGRRQWERLLTLGGGTVGPRTAAFTTVLGEAVAAYTAAQFVVAQMADAYVTDVLAAQGSAVSPSGAVVPSAFAGVTDAGMPAESLLLLPARRADYATARGLDWSVADQRALGQLQMYAATETADAGRLSAATAGVAAHVGGYIRHLTPPSCSRCAILAGRWYRYSAGFARHP